MTEWTEFLPAECYYTNDVNVFTMLCKNGVKKEDGGSRQLKVGSILYSLPLFNKIWLHIQRQYCSSSPDIDQKESNTHQFQN